MVGAVGALVSFVEGHQVLRELAGVTVDPQHVERTAEALGRAIAADERQGWIPARRQPRRCTSAWMARGFPCAAPT